MYLHTLRIAGRDVAQEELGREPIRDARVVALFEALCARKAQ